jgi:hypothetical protein
MSEFNQVSARLADQCEITHASAIVGGPFHKHALFSGSRGERRYFGALFTLKSQVIKWLADLAT